MNKVTRGEKFLQRLVDEHVISDCGRDWLIAAIDPFHDHQLTHLEGWPDLETGFSVVRCIKQSVTVARPSVVPATDNWDCHIVHWPWLTTNVSGGAGQFASSTLRSGQTYTMGNPPAAQASVGGLQAYGLVAGTNLNILQDASCVEIGRLNISSQYTSGAGRLVASGFEVHNTTADIYKQGSVAGYRMMANNREPTTMHFQQGANTGVYTCTEVRRPPLNLANALLLAGTRQWEAREGIYVVVPFDDLENPARPTGPTSPIITTADDEEGFINVNSIYAAVPGTPIAATAMAPMTAFRHHPIHQVGAIFTGLSPQSTLTINWNVYYECFPGLSQTNILPLATPSCEFDPDALDLYSRILADLPVAVQVKENGLGDWFLDAITTAAKYVAPVLKGLPHPLAQAGGVLADFIGETGGNFVKRNQVTQSPWETQSGMPKKKALPAKNKAKNKGKKPVKPVPKQ